MQILQEQKSALPPTPANRATEPSKNREVIYDQILSNGHGINQGVVGANSFALCG
jgi:hypothetical protein